MKIIPQGNKIKILPNENFNPKMLMEWRQRKGDPWIVAEDNLVNRIVLGMPYDIYDGVQPECSRGRLKEYQIADVKKMLSLKHSLNANPMGLGKTPETVRYLVELGVSNALIVTPKIIREQWVAQLERWGGLSASIVESQPYLTDDRVWVVNYDKLRNEKIRLKCRRFRWDCLVLDEAHKIKNRNSAQTNAVKEIPASHRVALTGTPILRYIDDLWSILHFLDVRYSGSKYWSFVDYFGKFEVTDYGKKLVGLTDDPAKVAILNTLLGLVAIRNNVEVAWGKEIEVVKLPMSKTQKKLYDAERNLVFDELPPDMTIPNGAVLTLRLRQTTSFPGMFIPGEAGPKFEWILETCRNNPEEKIVVFSVFEKVVKALVSYLNSNNVSACCITGTNTTEENQRAKKLFVEKSTQVIVGTIGAMGTGYDELQNVSHIMIMLDRDWSPELMNQAEERLHRMGQDNLVTVYYLECAKSFDQYVGKINVNKSNDIREALNDND